MGQVAAWYPIATCPNDQPVLMFFPADGKAHLGWAVWIGQPGGIPRQPTMWAPIPPITLAMMEQGVNMEVCDGSGKQCLSRDEAKRRVKQLVDEWGEKAEGETLRAYRCPRCQRWHVGHQFSQTRRHSK